MRRDFFKLKTPPEEIMKKFDIGAAALRRVIGGPLKDSRRGIEKIYHG